MKKNEFINQLRAQLKDLPAAEREEIISDYEEHFRHAKEKGRTDEEVIKRLGNPKTIAKEFTADYHLGEAKANHSLPSLTRAVFASLGLGLFNLILVLAPFVAVVGFIFSLYVLSGAFVLTPLVAVAAFAWESSVAKAIFNLFVTLILAGAGMMLYAGMNRASKAVIRWFTRYLQANLKIIKGEK
ncbi:hypothetical protein C1X05_03810 [Laceyella sacchari]|uniref:Uncharacterized membrane protein n=1 Tax=Laceyella tengchongensis TaxID=574699 RepID=A0AA45WJ32_9BACL|nr:DUF1700 domain-containing protein [Laceyella tengchongensis]AUS08034.1 hypothetical protein C1X05_03810 [Laceyella sacchari]SMP01885.1 Uncharacterized membrane protein [Laceyella tengchongensis]